MSYAAEYVSAHLKGHLAPDLLDFHAATRELLKEHQALTAAIKAMAEFMPLRTDIEDPDDIEAWSKARALYATALGGASRGPDFSEGGSR